MVLERIKHLFNVPRVVFVLAVDRSQLNQSVKTLYGLEANPDGYRPGIIQELRQHKLSIDTVNDWFANVNDLWYKIWFEAALIHVLDQKERQTRFEKFKEKFSKLENMPSFGFNPKQLAIDLGEGGYSQPFSFALSELEMTNQFR